MTGLRYILAVYMLALTVVPCADGLAHEHEDSGSRVCINHHPDQDDGCSPFCSCACCKVNITQAKVSRISPLEALIATYSFFPEPATCSIPHNIWQPPQA